MTTSISYVPASPASVQSVTRLRLYAVPSRTGTPVVDVGPADVQPDNSWQFTFTTPPDGFYYSTVTVTYTDGRVVDDKNDTVVLPAPPELQNDEQWVASWELDSPDDPQAREIARAASVLMFGLSGRKYTGTHTITETYTLADWSCGYASQTEQTLGVNLRAYTGRRPQAWSGRPDSRFRYDYLYLRHTPARVVSEVTYGPDFATVVDTTQYQLWDRAVLELKSGARHETRVTYTYGMKVPAAGRLAARALANELLKAASGDATCRLPDRVTSVSRLGVSYTIADSQDFLKDGRTGIYEIDLFLKVVNPDNARKKPRVFSPDLPRARRMG